MRKIPKDEITQRGCKFCLDVTWKRKGFAWFCPFEKCPYHELDDIKILSKKHFQVESLKPSLDLEKFLQKAKIVDRSLYFFVVYYIV